jgi:hypothetical protein
MDYINHTNGRHPMTITHDIEDTECAECGLPIGPDADWMSTLHGEDCSRRLAPAPVATRYMVRDDNTADIAGTTYTAVFDTLDGAQARRDERAEHYKPWAAARVRVFAITEVTR